MTAIFDDDPEVPEEAFDPALPPPALAAQRDVSEKATLAAVRKIGPGDSIGWTSVAGDGTERLRRGEVWTACPAPGTWWVVPEEGSERFVPVAWRSRRGRIGRGIVVEREGMPPRPGYAARAGRYVDRGEIYSEEHPLSPLGILVTRAAALVASPPTRIVMAPTIWLSWVSDEEEARARLALTRPRVRDLRT